MRTTKLPAIAAAALLAYGGGFTTHDDSSTEPPTTELGHTTTATGDTTAGAGAGPSDCPTIPATTTESSAPGTAAAGPATSEAAAAGTEPAGTDAATTPFVQVAQSEEFGEILVDSQCRALYAFTQDVDGEPTCVDDCAEAWPPLIVEDRTATFFPDYPDPELFTGVDHPEGEQVSFGGWPLYNFAQDTAPGDFNGQGVGGAWWLVAPDGTLVQDDTRETATSAPAS
jgi:predicted lipoprotein with Yx(FWY)xxD motif